MHQKQAKQAQALISNGLPDRFFKLNVSKKNHMHQKNDCPQSALAGIGFISATPMSALALVVQGAGERAAVKGRGWR